MNLCFFGLIAFLSALGVAIVQFTVSHHVGRVATIGFSGFLIFILRFLGPSSSVV